MGQGKKYSNWTVGEEPDFILEKAQVRRSRAIDFVCKPRAS